MLVVVFGASRTAPVYCEVQSQTNLSAVLLEKSGIDLLSAEWLQEQGYSNLPINTFRKRA